MNKKAIIVIIFFLLALCFGGYAYITSKNSNISGLKVVSTPTTSIFLNDVFVGKTPYDEKRPSGEYTLKLIPEESATAAASWQGRIILTPSVLTYVRRDLGASELMSGGEIVTLEKIPGNETEIEIVSIPDVASILIDGQEKGITPLLLREVLPGEHEVAVFSTGFIGRTVRAQATSGYKLSVNFQLSLSSSSEATSSVTPVVKEKQEEQKGPFIKIKDTPTGFLRIRSGPSLSASEAAQVKPGEKYPFLEEKEGWYKISYEKDKSGWVSGRYAEKIE